MKIWHLRSMLLTVSLITLLCPSARSQTVTISTRDQLLKAVDQAKPGTTIFIAPGTYHGGLHFSELQGEQDKPIILAASDKDIPPVFQGGGSCFHFTDPAYVELHNLILAGATGNGINIDDGGSYESPAHHLVLRALTIRDVGPAGNRDGVKLSGVDHFRVEQCIFERWGDNGSAIDMVGCHEGVISDCTFRYRSDVAANGVQTKGGSRNILIQRCRFENAGSRSVNIGGSTGLDYFRPKFDGYEAKDITVEDNTFVGSSAPICFVGVDGATVRYNTIYRPEQYVVRILQESQGDPFVPCRNGVFSHNLVAFRSDETRMTTNVGGGTAPDTFKFTHNHWYCLDRPDRSSRLSLPVKEADGTYGTDPQFVNAEAGDFQLKYTSPVDDAGVRLEKGGSPSRRR
ncbi:MAG: right-handed parallel beta-helix repeat-containing protein [Planctomycetaceae bacterium]